MYQLILLGVFILAWILLFVFSADKEVRKADYFWKISHYLLFFYAPASIFGVLIETIKINNNLSLTTKIALWAWLCVAILYILAKNDIKSRMENEIKELTDKCERLDYSYKQLDKDFESFRLKHQQANEKKLFATVEKFVKRFQSDAYEIDCLSDCLSYLKDERGYYPYVKDWTADTDFDKEAIECIRWCASDAIEWGKNNPQSPDVWYQWMQIYRGTIDWLLENGYVIQDEAESDCIWLHKQIRYSS